MVDALLYGPRRIAPKNQISLPTELMTAIGVTIGDNVFLLVNPDRPGSLVVLSQAAMADVVQKGWVAV